MDYGAYSRPPYRLPEKFGLADTIGRKPRCEVGVFFFGQPGFPQLVNGKYVPVVSDVMKNKTSCRTLPLIPAVEEELLKQKEKQQLYRKLFKKSYSTEYPDFVCTDQEGKLIRPNFVTEHFDWLLTKYELKHIRFHDLRHSCASLMVMNGVSMKQVQEWLGHSTFSTTADIYAHLDYKSKEGSAGVIAGLLETKK